jgi:hypothetical protein
MVALPAGPDTISVAFDNDSIADSRVNFLIADSQTVRINVSRVLFAVVKH